MAEVQIAQTDSIGRDMFNYFADLAVAASRPMLSIQAPVQELADIQSVTVATVDLVSAQAREELGTEVLRRQVENVARDEATEKAKQNLGSYLAELAGRKMIASTLDGKKSIPLYGYVIAGGGMMRYTVLKRVSRVEGTILPNSLDLDEALPRLTLGLSGHSFTVNIPLPFARNRLTTFSVLDREFRPRVALQVETQ